MRSLFSLAQWAKGSDKSPASLIKKTKERLAQEKHNFENCLTNGQVGNQVLFEHCTTCNAMHLNPQIMDSLTTWGGGKWVRVGVIFKLSTSKWRCNEYEAQYLFCDSIHTIILLDPLGRFSFILCKLFSNVWTDVSPAFLDKKPAKQNLQQISTQSLCHGTNFLHCARSTAT